MKLNLQIPEDIKSPTNKKSTLSPVGWWCVTTEGDVEGRSICTIGNFYGHVAEIAFSIDKGPCYRYEFSPLDLPPPKRYPEYIVKRVECSISIYAPHAEGEPAINNNSVKVMKNWLDTEDIIVSESRYYNSIKIALKIPNEN